MTKILVTSRGCYAVVKGVTTELGIDDCVDIDDAQASAFLRTGKATLVNNKADTDVSEQELSEAIAKPSTRRKSKSKSR